MIIGINGYAGSGKDTVGEIIKMQQPKENWEIKKFAGKLKEVASIILGIPKTMFEDQEFKKKTLPQMWSDHGLPMTVRDFLQRLGTDALRQGLHPNTWVNALMMEYKEVCFVGKDSEGADLFSYPNWIITDCRFPNEATAIKNAGGIIVRVNRPGVNAVNAHPSEVALSHWQFDYTIENNEGIVELKHKVRDILKQVYEDIAH
jgi:hypothetical protein